MKRIFAIAYLILTGCSVVHTNTSVVAHTNTSAVAHTNTLTEALDAKESGDFVSAYSLWLKLAEQGDEKAMVELGLMHHQGQGGPVDYDKAMDWYLKAYMRNGDAVNNIAVMYRDGLGVKVNRKIAYVLLLSVHMTGMGNQATISRVNRNLSREVEETSVAEKQEAVCYTMEYVKAYIESKGSLDSIPDELRASPERKRIKDFNWWMPGEMDSFKCPENT